MTFWQRLLVAGRLSLVKVISIFSASRFVRLIVQRKRNPDYHSEEDRALFELELSKIRGLGLSWGKN